MRHHGFSRATVLPLLVCAASAIASPDVDRILAEQDLNRDGVITQAEARAAANSELRKLDANRDGVLVSAEVSPWITASSPGKRGFPAPLHAELLKATMQLWDGNGDGRITATELQQAFVNLLLMADHDGDGQVTREELLAFHQGKVAPPR